MVLDPTPPIHLLSPMYWCHSGVSGGDGMEAIRYHEPGMVYLCNCFELWYMCCWHALRFHCAFSIVMRVLVSWVLRAAEPVLGRRFQVYCIRAWLIATTMLIQDCAHSNCSFLLVLEFYIEVNVYWLQLEFFFFFGLIRLPLEIILLSIINALWSRGVTLRWCGGWYGSQPYPIYLCNMYCPVGILRHTVISHFFTHPRNKWTGARGSHMDS